MSYVNGLMCQLLKVFADDLAWTLCTPWNLVQDLDTNGTVAMQLRFNHCKCVIIPPGAMSAEMQASWRELLRKAGKRTAITLCS
eukprot:536757-Amphidinium_carterae.1